MVACWMVLRVHEPAGYLELILFSYGAATVTRYVLRKELCSRIFAGLRREYRREEIL